MHSGDRRRESDEGIDTSGGELQKCAMAHDWTIIIPVYVNSGKPGKVHCRLV